MHRFLLAIVRILNRTPIMHNLRVARARRDLYFDPQIRQLKAVIKQLRAGKIDVLYLGDSSSRFYGEGDADQRQLPQMLAQELGMRVGLIAGAGYGPELHNEYVRILSTLPQRPKAVVLSRAVRICGSTHVVAHPAHGYQRSIERLRQIPGSRSRIRALGRSLEPTAEDMAQFRQLPVATRWQRGATIGEYLKVLRGRRHGPETRERQQVLFDYFHGEFYEASMPAVAQLHQLGERLRDYGVPVVHYWPPIPVEKGEEYFPGEFEAHVRANYAVVSRPFEEALGKAGALIETPFDTPDAEFIDSADGSEHWNDVGRLRIARRIAEEIRRAIEP